MAECSSFLYFMNLNLICFACMLGCLGSSYFCLIVIIKRDDCVCHSTSLSSRSGIMSSWPFNIAIERGLLSSMSEHVISAPFSNNIIVVFKCPSVIESMRGVQPANE